MANTDHSYETADARLEVSLIDNELVVLNLDNGCYYSIEGFGVDVWALIEAGATREQMVRELAERYGQSEDQVRAEVSGFLEKLVDEELVQPVTDGEAASNSGVFSDYTGWRAVYTPATIAKYDDLTESFALDPPLVIGGL
ncbi:MAG: PqqD family protein [Rhodobacteraceae bacterium]|nr:PqqD family protein [Paracoccaceae bacterium]